MTNLELIYENKIIFPQFLERKISIKHNKTLLYGVKSSGKTYLIYDYLSKNPDKNYIYIDMEDYKIDKNSLKFLEDFIYQHNIDILVIENYTKDIILPKVDSILLSTQDYINIEDFTILYIPPLDFEEFILFDTKHQNITNSFNSFLKYGNLAQIIDYKDYKKQLRNKEILELYEPNPTSREILKLLIKSSNELKSPFWLYSILKKQIKISKDFIYKQIKIYQNNKAIFLCEKYNQPKATKKIFCFNHALIDIVHFNKKFINIFTNMVFLELHNRYKEIFYLDNIDFYIPQTKTIILCTPFFNKLIFSNLSAKILKSIYNIDIEQIIFITINNNDENIFIDNINCEIIPFYEWALST